MTIYPTGIWTPVRSLAGCELSYSGPTRIKQDQLNPSHAKASNQSEIMGVSTCHNRCPLSKNIHAHLITSQRPTGTSRRPAPVKNTPIGHSLVKQYIVFHDLGSTPTNALQFHSPSVKKYQTYSESSLGLQTFAQKQNKAGQSHTVLFNLLAPEFGI